MALIEAKFSIDFQKESVHFYKLKALEKLGNIVAET
jgi:hypothetical protein